MVVRRGPSAEAAEAPRLLSDCHLAPVPKGSSFEFSVLGLTGATVLSLSLLILLIIGVLICGMCEVAANADEQAERDYALLVKLTRNPKT